MLSAFKLLFVKKKEGKKTLSKMFFSLFPWLKRNSHGVKNVATMLLKFKKKVYEYFPCLSSPFVASKVELFETQKHIPQAKDILAKDKTIKGLGVECTTSLF